MDNGQAFAIRHFILAPKNPKPKHENQKEKKEKNVVGIERNASVQPLIVVGLAFSMSATRVV